MGKKACEEILKIQTKALKESVEEKKWYQMYKETKY
jgi:hypothetical protein